uniref:Uncharacterized protein n=1 Tax=Pongo abelii TaxID=9601 RepID=A0A8I5UV61_PONAB
HKTFSGQEYSFNITEEKSVYGILTLVSSRKGKWASSYLKPFRRVTFSVVSQPQDPHQGSLQSCYDSGLEESETPSSKSSSGPRLGALPLPEDNYERTTPDGSVGEAEHMENGNIHFMENLTACPPIPGNIHETKK